MINSHSRSTHMGVERKAFFLLLALAVGSYGILIESQLVMGPEASLVLPSIGQQGAAFGLKKNRKSPRALVSGDRLSVDALQGRPECISKDSEEVGWLVEAANTLLCIASALVGAVAGSIVHPCGPEAP